MIRSLALAMALLALLLAAPAWFPRADAKREGPTVEELEERIEDLETNNGAALLVAESFVDRVLPPLVPIPATGVYPNEAYAGLNVLVLSCREGPPLADTDLAILGNRPLYCLRPDFSTAP